MLPGGDEGLLLIYAKSKGLIKKFPGTFSIFNWLLYLRDIATYQHYLEGEEKGTTPFLLVRER